MDEYTSAHILVHQKISWGYMELFKKCKIEISSLYYFCMKSLSTLHFFLLGSFFCARLTSFMVKMLMIISVTIFFASSSPRHSKKMMINTRREWGEVSKVKRLVRFLLCSFAAELLIVSSCTPSLISMMCTKKFFVVTCRAVVIMSPKTGYHQKCSRKLSQDKKEPPKNIFWWQSCLFLKSWWRWFTIIIFWN